MTFRSDVVVIGGGVIGVCAVYYLQRAGRRVTILERDEVCAGSSYGNSGLIVPSHSIPLPTPGAVGRALRWMLNPESPFYVRPRLDVGLMVWLWRFRAACTEARMKRAISVLAELTRASKDLYDELVPAEGVECGYTQRGLLLLYRTQRGLEDAQEETHLLREHGMEAGRLTGSEANEMEPAVRPDIAGAFHFEGDAHLNPAQFVNGLAAVVRERGVAIREGVDVLGLDSERGRIVGVRTSEGDYRPDLVVLAAGSWTPGVARGLRLRLRLPVQPAKGYSVTYERPGPAPTMPLILGEARVGVNPMGRAMRLAGTLELAGLDLSISGRRVDAIVRGAGRYLVGDAESASVSDHWCGLRPVTPDGLPIIGVPGSVSNLIVATGHAMLGMTLGPITGKMVAQIACGEAPTPDPSPVSPERFR